MDKIENMNDVSDMNPTERYELAKRLSEQVDMDPEFIKSVLVPHPISENEVFCRIPGWEDKYMVSNLGRVYSIPREVVSPSHIRHTVPRIKRQVINSTNYATVPLSLNGHPHTGLVNRLVAICFIPKTEEDIRLGRNDVDHISGVKHDNRVCNLRWLTREENKNAAILTGCIWHRITPEIYDKLVYDYTVLKISMPELSKKYGINRMAISNALFGKTFRPYNRPIVKHNFYDRVRKSQGQRQLTDEEITRVRQMINDNIEFEEISKVLDIDVATVRRINGNPKYPESHGKYYEKRRKKNSNQTNKQ